MAYDRITKHEEECNRRWDFARQEARETREQISEKLDRVVADQTVQLTRITTAQNKLFLAVSGGIIMILLSILGMLFHKVGVL